MLKRLWDTIHGWRKYYAGIIDENMEPKRTEHLFGHTCYRFVWKNEQQLSTSIFFTDWPRSRDFQAS